MRTKRPMFSVYPDPRSRAVCGQSSGAINDTIAFAAERIMRAHKGPLARLKPEDWHLLADVLNPAGTFDGNWGAEPLIATVEDANSMDSAGAKWYRRNPDARIGTLVEILFDSGDWGAWAIATAVRYFWDNHDDDESPVSLDNDEWWMPAFRAKREKQE